MTVLPRQRISANAGRYLGRRRWDRPAYRPAPREVRPLVRLLMTYASGIAWAAGVLTVALLTYAAGTVLL